MRKGDKTPAWTSAARWTNEEAEAALRALSRSGEPIGRFAAEHGISAPRLARWRRRFAALTPPAPPGFVEVLGKDMASWPRAAFEVVLHGGEIVRVPQQFEADALRELLAALRDGSRC